MLWQVRKFRKKKLKKYAGFLEFTRRAQNDWRIDDLFSTRDDPSAWLVTNSFSVGRIFARGRALGLTAHFDETGPSLYAGVWNSYCDDGHVHRELCFIDQATA